MLVDWIFAPLHFQDTRLEVLSSQVDQCWDKLGKECKEIWALQAYDAYLRVEPEEI